MDLGRLEAFVQVARTGSISKAAEALFVTQPAVTARLQTLERDLGVPLLVRSRHGSRLTEAGRAFLPHAEHALSAVDRGREAVEEVRSGGAGRLQIGAAPAVSTYVLPAMLHRFQAKHPGVRLVVRSGHSEEILQMVLREEVEIGLMRPIAHPEVSATLLYEDELVLVVHRGHRFAAGGHVRMGELAAEHLILFDRTSSYHELTSAIVRQAGISPRGRLEVDNIDAAKRMVEQRLGVALLPRTSVQADIGAGRLVPVTITDMAPITRQIVVARRRDAGEVSPGAGRVPGDPGHAPAGCRPGASVPGLARHLLADDGATAGAADRVVAGGVVHRLIAGVGVQVDLLRADRVCLDEPRPVLRGQRLRPGEQGARHAHALGGGVNVEADDRPDRLIIHAVQRGRVFQSIEHLARPDAAPADRHAVHVGQQAGLAAALHLALQSTPPGCAPLVRRLLAAQQPELAPAAVGDRRAAARSLAREEVDQVRPAVRGDRRHLDHGPGPRRVAFEEDFAAGMAVSLWTHRSCHGRN